LAFGQIRDGKNLDLFLRAMTRLPENVKLLVAGKGDSGSSRPPEYYQKMAEELGVAEHCRWDIRRIPEDEVGDIFAASDVVLGDLQREIPLGERRAECSGFSAEAGVGFVWARAVKNCGGKIPTGCIRRARRS
jgi:hypothetical protein